MSKKSQTKSKRNAYVKNFLWSLVTDQYGDWARHVSGTKRNPEDPWSHIPFEDIMKALKIWKEVYSTSVPIMQFMEQSLGSPRQKKYGDEPK